MIRLATSAFALSVLAGAAVAEPVAFDFDKSHSNLSFTYDHLGYSTTDGRFGDWDGKLMIDQGNTVQFFRSNSRSTSTASTHFGQSATRTS